MNSATRQLFVATRTAISLMGTKVTLEQGFRFTYQVISGLALVGLMLSFTLPRKP
ncbi:UNVERIFIED_CONTAM: hypothetical protein KB574_02185 [Streptococcus canis]|uniref:Uncharacterized protein n=1 Tax=Streptococcus canis FSL Z3-227 TaxID=482234 RepID=A0AAV3FVG2_STRCB|nr:hypothetical protein [Streptococcus canis]EIQ82719.1 hypothetical protein SCAZ3_10170 [Streptococcus canis FSL Z3-227]MDV5989040.1 hypothetical protein [Streptococcus canis]MDV5993842.1 hypothetical protein [Streptococcus canis]MDV6000885.1 hypothetical protein [Streptococcus canis]MDV6022450.1 hypothetical protein [Streptococcus canis]